MLDSTFYDAYRPPSQLCRVIFANQISASSAEAAELASFFIDDQLARLSDSRRHVKMIDGRQTAPIPTWNTNALYADNEIHPPLRGNNTKLIVIIDMPI